jgi:hypothetical protein
MGVDPVGAALIPQRRAGIRYESSIEIRPLLRPPETTDEPTNGGDDTLGTFNRARVSGQAMIDSAAASSCAASASTPRSSSTRSTVARSTAVASTLASSSPARSRPATRSTSSPDRNDSGRARPLATGGRPALYVDFDLSAANVHPGTRLAVGVAEIEVTDAETAVLIAVIARSADRTRAPCPATRPSDPVMTVMPHRGTLRSSYGAQHRAGHRRAIACPGAGRLDSAVPTVSAGKSARTCRRSVGPRSRRTRPRSRTCASCRAA